MTMIISGRILKRGEEEEEEEAAIQQPGEKRRGEISRGLMSRSSLQSFNCDVSGQRLEGPQGRRSTTRVTDTELQRRSTRVGIATGRETGAGHPRVPASPTRSPGAPRHFLSVFYTVPCTHVT